MAGLFQGAEDARADEAAMAGDINSGIFFHGEILEEGSKGSRVKTR
jgi:hypothetical protein